MRSLTAGEARRGEGVKVKLRRNASISYFLGRGGGGVLLLHGEHLALIQPKHPNWGTISGDTQQRWPPASLHARKLWPIVMRELFVFGPKLSWNSIGGQHLSTWEELPLKAWMTCHTKLYCRTKLQTPVVVTIDLSRATGPLLWHHLRLITGLIFLTRTFESIIITSSSS